MQDSSQAARRPLLLDKRKAIFPGIVAIVGRPAVNNDGQLHRSRQFHLPHENLTFCTRAANGHKNNRDPISPHAMTLGFLARLLHLSNAVSVGQAGLVGMDPERRIDK